MAQRLTVLRSDNDSCSVSISPVIKLARCVTTEETLEQLAEIVAGKGILLLGIRLSRPGINREWKPREAFPVTEVSYEINAQVEGEQTHIVLRLAGDINPDVCCEIESASYMAAHRIELCERKLWSGKSEATSDPTIELEGLIGSSEPVRALKRSIKSAASCDSMTLIMGESGTGKELAARGIHNLSARAGRPFVAVNCGAFAEALLESELFGYVKGAFTGAVANRKGLFEAANGGTIFLDEIGEMPLAMQVKLLRVLQERKIRQIGAHSETEIDVRVIAATNRDLRREMEERRFREDLYYRLHVLVIRLPALRERKTDISLLVPHLLKGIQQKMKRDSSLEIEEAALRALCDYHWPGNVRELENTLERLSAQLDKGRVITIEQVRSETQFRQSLPTIIGNEIEYRVVLRAGESLDEHLKLQQLKIYEIVRAHFGGNHTQAARWLGVERTALYRRVDRARQRTNNWPST